MIWNPAAPAGTPNQKLVAAIKRADASDALAVAICHAHHRSSRLRWGMGARSA